MRFAAYNVAGAALWTVAFVMLGYVVGASWQVAERWIGRATAITGGAVLVVLGAIWAWRWLSQHEGGVRVRWAAVMEHPRVCAIRERLAPQIEFPQDRLSPSRLLKYLG